jgi:hypothetical protein
MVIEILKRLYIAISVSIFVGESTWGPSAGDLILPEVVRKTGSLLNLLSYSPHSPLPHPT